MPLPRMRCSLRYLPGSRNKWKRKQNGPESIGTILLLQNYGKKEWGETPEYKEFEEKTAHKTEKEVKDMSSQLMDIDRKSVV